jgi:mannonate dehydratase
MAVTDTPGIKICVMVSPDTRDEELIFAKQLGVTHVFTWVDTEGPSEYQSLFSIRKKIESFDLTLHNVGHNKLAKVDRIHLNLPGRDEAIERFKEFIRNLGKAGIHTTTFTWEQALARSTAPERVRGGALARAVDMEVLQKEPPSHEGKYTEKDIWDNFTYFIEQVIPAAEEAGVRLALHPNDPPVPQIGGIPCLIHSFETYKRAFAIADSDNLGMEFCVGCWLQGGKNFGDLFEGIKHFVERNKVFIVHFRNVSSSHPHFVETFLDEGYMDMYRVMRAFQEAGYDGTMINDHTPHMINDPGDSKAIAYAVGYMKALLKWARSEVGGA